MVPGSSIACRDFKLSVSGGGFCMSMLEVEASPAEKQYRQVTLKAGFREGNATYSHSFPL